MKTVILLQQVRHKLVNKIWRDSQNGSLTNAQQLVDLAENEQNFNSCGEEHLNPRSLLSSLQEQGLEERDNSESEGQEGNNTLNEENHLTDIKLLQGGKAMYFFSELYMTREYANMLVNLEEGDNAKLIADIVRKDSHKYPRPTDSRVFSKFPFFLSQEELQQLLTDMEKHKDFQDIKTVLAYNNSLYLYSDQYMKGKYAQALANKLEKKLKYNH